MKSGNAWFEYLYLSNELVTPHLLACPSDSGVKVASQWSTGPNAFVNGPFRSQAVSYLLGLHANSIRPMAIVAADFNVQLFPGGSCGPAAVNNALSIFTSPSPPPESESVRWTNGPHLSAGHLLVVDGSVMFLNSRGLTRTVSAQNSTDNVHHILRAR
jgi:hypothetical protein